MRPRSILIIDDDEQTRAFLQHGPGYMVIEASMARQASANSDRHPPFSELLSNMLNKPIAYLFRQTHAHDVNESSYPNHVAPTASRAWPCSHSKQLTDGAPITGGCASGD